MKLLEGKTALITGASKGIGRTIAAKFAEHGANVAFTYLSSVEKGQALEQELQAHGTQVKGYRSDASKFDEADKNSDARLFGNMRYTSRLVGIHARLSASEVVLNQLSQSRYQSTGFMCNKPNFNGPTMGGDRKRSVRKIQ